MLIDNYALQKAVIDSEIPDHMLSGLDALGVTGLAVLADGLRKPIAVERPLLTACRLARHHLPGLPLAGPRRGDPGLGRQSDGPMG